MKRFLCLLALLATPAQADDGFVESNILAIFYHELGHALIDVLDLPVFGQEEDAADVLSIYLIDQLYEPEVAEEIATDSANLFAAEADETQDDVPYWGVHGPDAQRFFNTICLFVGADLGRRSDMARDFGLPEERLETCEDEFDQANNAWGAVLDRITGPGTSLRFEGDDDLISQIISAEVDALNADFNLPTNVDVIVAFCDEANAFYDPGDQSITMCLELVDYLTERAP